MIAKIHNRLLSCNEFSHKRSPTYDQKLQKVLKSFSHPRKNCLQRCKIKHPILPKMAKTFHKIPTFLHFTLEKFELYQHLGKNILTNTHKELSCLNKIESTTRKM